MELKDEVMNVALRQKAYQGVPHGANWIQFANAAYSLFRDHGEKLSNEISRDGVIIRAGEYFSEHDLEALGLSADWNVQLIPMQESQSVSQFARIEKLEDDLKQANNIIRYNDGEVARLSVCEVDAARYRALRAADARSGEELDAYCDDLIEKSEPPKGGGQ